MLVVYDRAVRSLNYSKAEKPSALFGAAYKGYATEVLGRRGGHSSETVLSLYEWSALPEII